MDISISPAADLAASAWTLPQSHNSAIIPENESFHQALQSASGKTDTPEKIAGVAKQFEAMMIGQILKSAREASGGGWLGSDDDQNDQSGSPLMELAEQGLSQAMAAHGGMGIAKMVTANLERSESKGEGHAAKTASSSEAPPIATHTDSERATRLAEAQTNKLPYSGRLQPPDR
jgi:Rod binding domain-containing protein